MTTKKEIIFKAALIGFSVSSLISCTSTQVTGPGYDDAYFSSSDRAKAQSSRQGGNQNETQTYPNNYNNDGSLNPYAGGQAPAGGENQTQNPNAAQAGADYVNPDYRASGPVGDGNQDAGRGQNGTTIINNNYYDTDHYYRSAFRNTFFNPIFTPMPVFGMGWPGAGFGIGLGWNSGFGVYGPVVGLNYGWGNPYLGWGWRNRWGWNAGWGIGYGWGSWCGWNMGFGGMYDPFFDPFWGPGFGYNPFWNPWGPWNRPIYSPYYGYNNGNGWGGNGENQSGGGRRVRTNMPITNMSGNAGGNVISTGQGPTGGRNNRAATENQTGATNPAGGRAGQGTSPVFRNPGTNTSASGNTAEAPGQPQAETGRGQTSGFRNPNPDNNPPQPVSGNNTPERYQPQVTPSTYTPAQPGRQESPNTPGFRNTNPSYVPPPTSTPSQPERNTGRFFRNDNTPTQPYQQSPPPRQEQSWDYPRSSGSSGSFFRNNNTGGSESSFGGNRSSGSSFGGGRHSGSSFGGGSSGGSGRSSGSFGGGGRSSGGSGPTGGRRR